MKKTIFLILVLISLLATSACSSQSPAPPAPSQASPAAPAATSAPAASSTSAPTAAATQAAGKPIELRFAHQNPPNGRTTLKYLNVWAKKVEDVTKGKVKMVMYPAESLCKASESVTATVGGVTDVTWTVLGYFPGKYPLTTVTSNPFLNLPSGKVDGRTLSAAAINSRILEELYETTPEIQAEFKEVKVLFLHTSDPYFLVTTKKPVRSQADLKGMKIRELGGYPSDMWKLLGASPLLMPMPDVYDAGQKGVIDGMGNVFAAIGTYKLYEVFKYWTDVSTYVSGFEVIMNKETWASLPPDVQQGIMSVSGMAGAEFAGEAGWGKDVQTEVEEVMQKQGYKMERIGLEASEIDNWKTIAGKPLWNKWVDEMKSKNLPGQKVLDASLKLLDKYK
jgi:TRAP-type transport system periplasmic protein